MHVLVATRRTQRQRHGDYSDAADGELVTLPVVECACWDDATFPGHARIFVGVDSGGATTTAEVVEIDVTDDAIAGYIAEALSRHGARDRETVATVAWRLATEMLAVARRFPVGTVVVKRGDLLLARGARGAGRPPPCGSGGTARGP